MSELIATTNRKNLRWQLLTTVSAASLAVSLAATSRAAAEEGRPTIWVELGGQLEAVGGNEDRYGPAFTIANLSKPLNAISPLSAQRPPHFSFGGEGKLLLEPAGTDWIFSVGVRYGRSNGIKSLHQQTSFQSVQKTLKYGVTNLLNGHISHNFVTRTRTRFNDTSIKYTESHAIVDFMAGKDVGLGAFGRGSSSVVGLGVRFAQFHTNSQSVFRSQPDPHFPTKAATVANAGYHRISYYASGNFTRAFRGIGPALSWEASAPVLGRADSSEVTFDWGINAAALFGRQKVRGNHETTGQYFRGYRGTVTTRYIETKPVSRSRTVFVPNVGGFAGISVRKANAKISLGYRADFFFNAMDQGVDTHQSGTRGFYGPFATVSLGLGG